MGREYRFEGKTYGEECIHRVMDREKAMLLAAGEPPLGQVIGALDRKLTSLLQFMAELKRGKSPKEAAMHLRLPGFIVHGLYEASKRGTTAEIIHIYPSIAEIASHSDKTGALELLIRTTTDP